MPFSALPRSIAGHAHRGRERNREYQEEAVSATRATPRRRPQQRQQEWQHGRTRRSTKKRQRGNKEKKTKKKKRDAPRRAGLRPRFIFFFLIDRSKCFARPVISWCEGFHLLLSTASRTWATGCIAALDHCTSGIVFGGHRGFDLSGLPAPVAPRTESTIISAVG